MGAARKAGRGLAWGAAAVLGAATFTGISVAAADTGTTEQQQATQAEERAYGQGNGQGRGQGQGQGYRYGQAQGDGQGSADGQRGGMGRAPHSERVMEGEDGSVTVLSQRGEVTAVSEDSLTVRSSDRFTETWSFGDDLTVRVDGEDAAVGDIEAGDSVRVVGVETEDGAEARHIGIQTGTQEPGDRDDRDRDRDRDRDEMMEDLLNG